MTEMTRSEVVVIDDNADAREMLAMLLGMWGYVVGSAEDGLDGLALIRAHRPRVALVDIGLPGLDGYGVARQTRLSRHGGDVVLIAVTGYNQDHDRRRAIEAGFDAYLVKPVDPYELRRLLSTVMTPGGLVGQPA